MHFEGLSQAFSDQVIVMRWFPRLIPSNSVQEGMALCTKKKPSGPTSFLGERKVASINA